jgi:hypothetical protein
VYTWTHARARVRAKKKGPGTRVPGTTYALRPYRVLTRAGSLPEPGPYPVPGPYRVLTGSLPGMRYARIGSLPEPGPYPDRVLTPYRVLTGSLPGPYPVRGTRVPGGRGQ